MKKHLLAAALAMATLGYSASGIAAETGTITVFKSPYCGCCEVWTKAVEKAGYNVIVRNMDDLETIKKQAGVPSEMEGCHTAILNGPKTYVLEGHVPLEAIDKLRAETPDIAGLAVPGMPDGSLGMDYDPDARYTVYAFSPVPSTPPTVFFEAGK
ncbi:MAG: CopG family transcriptional regulator [Hyphomicrobiales bacterium]|nr:MAG: CopG family transcriptional regulator [Hyphomicrobiales bacterium]